MKGLIFNVIVLCFLCFSTHPGKPLKRFSAFSVTLSHQAKAWCE